MKKICFLEYDSSIMGGTGKVTEMLSNHFCKDYEVYIYSMKLENGAIAYNKNDNVSFFANNIKGKDVRLRHVIANNRKQFPRYIRENEIDVVIAVSTYAGLLCAISPLKARKIFADHGALINQLSDKGTSFIRYISAHLTHKTVVLTDKTKSDYENIFKIKSKKVVRIYNSIDDTLKSYFDKYQSNSKKIISVGRVSSEKGYDLLLEVAKIVLLNNPDYEWDIYGEGDLLEGMKEKAREYGLSNQLKFLGTDDTVTKKLYQYSMLVLPSYREGLPLVLLEAKTCGLPLVSFNIQTGPAEIIKNEVNGYLVEPYDINDMASKVEKLINSVELRELFHENSKLDLDKFSIEDIIKQWYTLFEEV